MIFRIVAAFGLIVGVTLLGLEMARTEQDAFVLIMAMFSIIFGGWGIFTDD